MDYRMLGDILPAVEKMCIRDSLSSLNILRIRRSRPWAWLPLALWM